MSHEAAPEDIQAVVIGAIAAAGPRDGNDARWKAKVNAAIPHVAAMIGASSRQSKDAQAVLEAVIFDAEYIGYKVEATSKRCLVQLKTRPSKNYPDGIEPIRTNRTDNASGKEMQRRLDELSEGDSLLVWKAIEASDDGNEKYRVLVHFEVRPKWDKEKQQPQQQPQEKVQDYSDKTDTERLVGWRAATRERLTDSQMGTVVIRLMEKGYDFDGVSEIEWVDEVRPIIRAVLDGNQQEGN